MPISNSCSRSPRGPSGASLFPEVVLVKLMTVAEVANFLDKPRSWVYENWRGEEIPFRKVGQALRCRPADLEKWLDSQS
ncbi:helix-turn-helix domain-containing protein [Streptomyces anulatus]|uniref:helix-turn-helix domain-containing protein n=1 Tax=Streptomyces anulatus TaxID=1892 RepID=UPI00364F1695